MKCAARRCWKAASPMKRSPRFTRRLRSRTTHPSSRCYLGKRWSLPIIRRTPMRRFRFCAQRWRGKPRHRSVTCNWLAYGRKGDYAEADLASAQAAYLRGDSKTARELASRAKTRFAIGTPGWVKADDIVTAKPLPGQKSE